MGVRTWCSIGDVASFWQVPWPAGQGQIAKISGHIDISLAHFPLPVCRFCILLRPNIGPNERTDGFRSLRSEKRFYVHGSRALVPPAISIDRLKRWWELSGCRGEDFLCIELRNDFFRISCQIAGSSRFVGIDFPTNLEEPVSSGGLFGPSVQELVVKPDSRTQRAEDPRCRDQEPVVAPTRRRHDAARFPAPVKRKGSPPRPAGSQF